MCALVRHFRCSFQVSSSVGVYQEMKADHYTHFQPCVDWSLRRSLKKLNTHQRLIKCSEVRHLSITCWKAEAFTNTNNAVPLDVEKVWRNSFGRLPPIGEQAFNVFWISASSRCGSATTHKCDTTSARPRSTEEVTFAVATHWTSSSYSSRCKCPTQKSISCPTRREPRKSDGLP